MASFWTLDNIIVLILAIVGLIWLINGLWKNWKIRNIRSWPKADATIISSVAQPADGSSSAFVDPRFIVATTGYIN